MKRQLRAMRAELHDKQNRVKYALLNEPVQRCTPAYLCSLCKPDYIMAVVMGLHPRLGEESPVAALLPDLLQMIIDMTKHKRQLPAWMSCSWDLNTAKTRQARAVLDCSRAAQRRREDERAHG